MSEAGLAVRERVTRVEALLSAPAARFVMGMEAGLSRDDAMRLAGDGATPLQAELTGETTARGLGLLAAQVWGEAACTLGIDVMGIDWLTPDDVRTARRSGQQWRLLGVATPRCCRVEPTLLPLGHQLTRALAPTYVTTSRPAGDWLRTG